MICLHWRQPICLGCNVSLACMVWCVLVQVISLLYWLFKSAKCKFHIWPTYSTRNQSYVRYNLQQSWFQHCLNVHTLACMYMFVFFNNCIYHVCQPLHTSIVHTLYTHGSDMSVHVYARWSGFQMHCNFRKDCLSSSSLQASIHQCALPMEWIHALKPMKSYLLALRC